jgi:phospholipid/cholesterol/gamma-HCH transport system substrate-binding protein
MTGYRWTSIKFGLFAIVAATLTVCLFFVFGQFRTEPTSGYSALFHDVSRLKAGDSVRIAGIRVGTVNTVSLQADKNVLVSFDADREIALTTGTRAEVRYLNLVGDRYLDLVDGAGSTRILPRGSQIPIDRTAPALDLDMLLGGLKPVVRGLNPQDVNAFTASLLEVLQGQDGTLESLMTKTASFTNSLADNAQVVQQLIDNLTAVLETLTNDGGKFSATIDRLEQLISGLAADRDPIGNAIEAMDNGTASVADLLTQSRPALAGNVDQLNRLAPLLDNDKGLVDSSLQKLPEDYRKLVRLASYGAWLNLYECGVSARLTDLQGRTVVYPWFRQEGGRCADS